MGAVIADIEPGGGVSESFRTFLQSSVAGSVAVQGRDVGAYPKIYSL